MLRARRDLPILVPLVGFALILVALAVSGSSASKTQRLDSAPNATREVKRDTYSGLVRAARRPQGLPPAATEYLGR